MNKTRLLSDHLSPFAHRMRTRKPRQFSICRITGELLGVNAELSMENARTQSLAWLQRRSGKLPKSAWQYLSFDNLIPGRQAQAVRISNEEMDYWCARLDDSDKDVAGRVWTTELTVAHKKSNSRAVFGLRQVVTTLEDEPAFTPALPGVIRQVSESPGLARGRRPISQKPILVSTKAEVEQLIELIEDKSRIMPVYVLALGEGQEELNDAIIDPESFARRCVAIAHVSVITGPASYQLTDRLGKSLSVFHRAIRTYRTGFDYSDSPFDHPLALPHAISSWNDIGPASFADFLVDRAAAESVRHSRDDTDLPMFSSVKQMEIRVARQKTEQTEDNALAIAVDEIEALNNEKKEWESLYESSEEEVSRLQDRLRELESQNAHFRSRINGLEHQIDISSSHTEREELRIPTSLDDIRAWVEEHLAGRVLVTGKAVRAAKGTVFHDTTLAYRAILLLGTEYREMRIKGDEVSLKAYQAKLAELGLEDSLSGEEMRLRKQGDEFFVMYGNRKHFLKHHLKRGNARDPRYCFRCYYFWDDETEQVVIGSLPSHLRTSIS